jgi:SAM-dependent methyltransferase
MSTIPDGPYYAAYERRYASLYAQGVQHWTAHPEELRVISEAVGAFLGTVTPQTPRPLHVIEFSCGEGFVGEVLLSQGHRYTGIDLAPSAIEKARVRLGKFGDRVCLLVADILDLSSISAATFDAGIDIGCLHMLVVDADRNRYLRNAHRILKSEARMLFREAYRSDASAEIVASYEAWVEKTGVDVGKPQVREAWVNGKRIEVEIPCIAARARTVEQYRQELADLGFGFMEYQLSEDGLCVSFHVKRD